MHILAPNGTAETYPYSIGQLRKDNPQVSFPKNPTDELLADYSVFPVTTTERPAFDTATQGLTEGTPALVGGAWAQAWTVRDLTAEEVEARRQEVMEDYRRAIEAHVDAAAVSRDYANAVSLASYAASTNAAWAAEAAAFIAWRDAVWAYVYAQLALVQSGDRVQPTAAELVAELPAIVWPEGSPE